jgi:hypothetical protein
MNEVQMPAAGMGAVSARRVKAMLRDELHSFARGSVAELNRLSETSEHVRRARPVVLATVARAGRVLRTVQKQGPAIRPRPVFDQAYYRAVAAGRLLKAHRPLTVAAAGVGGGLDVSVRLYGAAEACAAVTGLGLRPVDPESRVRVPVPTTVVHSGTSVRLAAGLPAERFAPPGATWQLEVIDTHGPVTVVVPRPAVLEHRWPAGSKKGKAPWPARLTVDRRGRLQVSAAVPSGPVVDHDVHVGLAAVTISWRDEAADAALGLKLRGTAEILEVPATRGADGRYSVQLDAHQLRVQPPPARWDLSVRSGDGPWIRLQRPKGQYPPLRRLVAFATFPVSVPDRPPLTAQVYYNEENRLAIQVENALRRAR